MTCRPLTMHPLDALYQAARRYPGGVEALARRLNETGRSNVQPLPRKA